MAATPHDSSGTTLTVAGSTFTVTSITINFTDPGGADEIDISHLGQTTGETIVTIPTPLKGAVGDTGKEISFDYIGTDAAVGRHDWCLRYCWCRVLVWHCMHGV
jgi:hypothetical protein